jgi:hypothetical protein
MLARLLVRILHLAVVVVGKRRKLRNEQDEEHTIIYHYHDKNDGSTTTARTTTNGRKDSSVSAVDDDTTRNTKDRSKLPSVSSLLDSCFNNKKAPAAAATGGSSSSPSPSPSSSSLLNSPNRAHIDQMFQVAKSMVAIAAGKPAREARNPALAGTASHLAQQLQVWLLQQQQQQQQQHEQKQEQEQDEQEQEEPPTRPAAAVAAAARVREQESSSTSSSSSTVRVVHDWIRSHLTLTAMLEEPSSSSFAVFQAIIQQATNEVLVSTVLSVVVRILRELYYDEFAASSPSSSSSTSIVVNLIKHSTTTMTMTPTTSRTRLSLDLLATHSLRLLYTCLDWYNKNSCYYSYARGRQHLQQYHNRFGGGGGGGRGIQVLHECLAGDEELLVPLPFSRLPRKYASRKSTGSGIGLDPGAKLLLRLSLYRCLLVRYSAGSSHHHIGNITGNDDRRSISN